MAGGRVQKISKFFEKQVKNFYIFKRFQMFTYVVDYTLLPTAL